MSAVALSGALLALVLLLPVRIALQRRWTGGSGIVLAAVPAGPPRTARALLAGGTLLTGLGPALDLLDVGWAWEPADAFLTHAVGFVLLIGGCGWAFWAQLTMREAWRVGQDDGERLRLVTDGPFAQVRHPIYGGMIAIGLGVTLLSPTLIGAVGAALLAVGAVLQAIRVEEPHLRAVHGTTYWAWARRTGRFLPRVR
ncbi:methyltransferase family protein [Patulibacter defluvii]|uniref:methyltransferase family protein n=1 Tax=Patulibacter defluvii TaxID=3095358 RepID=UPI002A747DF7|nr:isoprenylcysteine carboxylmethyltransferase family protein [Patulibacter sp. DM4]